MASIGLLLCRRSTPIVSQVMARNVVKTCCEHSVRSKQTVTQMSKELFRHQSESIVLNHKCWIHLSPQRHNPLVSIVIRQAAKFVALLTGRAVRKWWRELPPNKREIVTKWLSRHKWKFGFAFLSAVLLSIAYYLSHLEETPITRRKRFIAFTPKQLKDLNNYEFEVQLETYKNKLLSSSHEVSRRVARVATQLLNANNDLPQIHDHEWSVSVVDDINHKNAFVMPSGQIFVFTGMLAICDNDQQLGSVLAHEMAHAVLAHGAELVSHAHLIDMLFICLIGIIWTILPTDITATITTGISRLIMNVILDTPYSRMLETEADVVGLELAAKACFDVRETSAFWHKMSIIESTEGIQFSSDDIKIPVKTEFLSTHPSHEARYHYLDSLMDDAIKLRDKCNCPQLPKHDPRLTVELLKKNIADYHKNKRKEGVLILPKPPVPQNLQPRS